MKTKHALRIRCLFCRELIVNPRETKDGKHACRKAACRKKLTYVRKHGELPPKAICAFCKQPLKYRKIPSKLQWHGVGQCAVAKASYWRSQLSQGDRETVRSRTKTVKRARKDPHTVLSPTLSETRGKAFRGGRKRKNILLEPQP